LCLIGLSTALCFAVWQLPENPLWVDTLRFDERERLLWPLLNGLAAALIAHFVLPKAPSQPEMLSAN
jgi:hypothetical protein